MMDEQKQLSKKTNFVLYGGGEVGNNCYKSLCEKGYHVVAALDKNKSGAHIIEGLYTYKLGEEPDELDKTNFVVMICLANGMIHKDVADQLYTLGYSYIIFLPMKYCLPDEQKRGLTRLYNYVLLADSFMDTCVVGKYDQYAVPNLSIETGVICETTHNKTVWMGLEMLFSESLELWKGDKEKILTKSKYKDRNIACANPCEDLFNYFAMKNQSYDVYFNSRKKQKSNEEKEKELKQREELYRLFKREHVKGLGFFIDGAPQVVWNPNNYCNLVGGHHRTLYLLQEGHSLFPVKMSYDDFNKWCNEEVYQKLRVYVYENKIEQFYAPLPHPGFLNFPVQWEDIGKTKLATVMRFFADIDMADMTMLDYSNDEGYFARNFDRAGVKKSVFANRNVQQTELALLFNSLLYRNDVIVKLSGLEELSKNSNFDIVFVVGHRVENISITHLNLLGMLCKQYLIMETVNSMEIESIQKCTGLSNYVCLHKEYKTGQIWELGVYCR